MSRSPRLFHLLQLAAHRLRTAADRESLARAGVTAAQGGALFLIAKTQGATQRDVAQALHQRESAVTAMVGRLVAAGLVERERAPDDARAWVLALTPAGARALDAVRAQTRTFNARLKAELGAADHAALARALETLVDMNLEDEAAGAAK